MCGCCGRFGGGTWGRHHFCGFRQIWIGESPCVVFSLQCGLLWLWWAKGLSFSSVELVEVRFWLLVAGSIDPSSSSGAMHHQILRLILFRGLVGIALIAGLGFTNDEQRWANSFSDSGGVVDFFSRCSGGSYLVVDWMRGHDALVLGW